MVPRKLVSALLRLKARAERRIAKLDKQIQELPEFQKGTYVEALGVGVTTPCCEVSDDVLRRRIRSAIVQERLPPRPHGALVCHRCDNPKCVAADHLFWGTYSDNRRDCALKGRDGSRRRGVPRPLRLARAKAWTEEILAATAALLEASDRSE